MNAPDLNDDKDDFNGPLHAETGPHTITHFNDDGPHPLITIHTGPRELKPTIDICIYPTNNFHALVQHYVVAIRPTDHKIIINGELHRAYQIGSVLSRPNTL